MYMAIVLIIVGLAILLDLAAVRYGVDSRTRDVDGPWQWSH